MVLWSLDKSGPELRVYRGFVLPIHLNGVRQLGYFIYTTKVVILDLPAENCDQSALVETRLTWL